VRHKSQAFEEKIMRLLLVMALFTTSVFAQQATSATNAYLVCVSSSGTRMILKNGKLSINYQHVIWDPIDPTPLPPFPPGQYLDDPASFPIPYSKLNKQKYRQANTSGMKYIRGNVIEIYKNLRGTAITFDAFTFVQPDPTSQIPSDFMVDVRVDILSRSVSFWSSDNFGNAAICDRQFAQNFNTRLR
jgi:hypothetical protein